MDDIALLRTVADYQFGRGAGVALFADSEALSLTHTSSGRPRQVHAPSGRVGTYGTDGRLRLGLAGARRLRERGVADRVTVGAESVPYVRKGKNAFAKFVLAADEGIRPRDEVVVEGPEGELLGVGRAELAGPGMLEFETGVAVDIREGCVTVTTDE